MKKKRPEPRVIRPDDVNPHHDWKRPLQAPGHTAVPESGDLGAFVVTEDGTAAATVTTTAFTIEDLQGPEGTSVVVHEETAGGARLACGVIG